MIEFLKKYTISNNTAFVLFSITILMDLVYKIFTDLGIVKKGTALYVYWIQIAFYLIIIVFCKDIALRVLYGMNCAMTILNFHNDWRINHPSKRKTTVIVPVLPDEIREDILQNIPPKKDGAVPYLWKSNLPEDEEKLKRYLLDSEIVQLTYVPCLKRILFKRTKVELQFIAN